MNTEIETLKLELAAFKKNNEELIHRCNAAVASWDEERKRAMHEAEKFLDTTNGGPRSADCLRYMYSNILYKLCPEWVIYYTNYVQNG